jgi:myo-inositol 2-dehydrogenase/D-chiro-inositol 1-dehydrogenase
MRIALVGAGAIASRHLNSLAQTDVTFEVVGHLSRSLTSAQKAARDFGGQAFSSIEELLQAGRPDAVIVTVPPHQHGDIEAALIDAGTPFLVEKPIGLDLAGPVAIGKAIEAKNLVAAVGYNWRALDVLSRVKDQLAKTPARMVMARFHIGTPTAPWWRFEASSGGQMVEQACHMIDLARHLVGEGSFVGASGTRANLPGFSDGDVAGASAALFQFGGVPAVVTATCILPDGTGAEFRLICEDCEIVITLEGVMIQKGRDIERYVVQASSYTLQNQCFFNAVRRGDPSLVTCSYADALVSHQLSLEAGQAIRKSAEIS